jgi:hypothetical protein
VRDKRSHSECDRKSVKPPFFIDDGYVETETEELYNESVTKGSLKKSKKLTIRKEELRPRERAPILPSKTFEDKRRRDELKPKHRRDIRKQIEED